MEKDNPAKVLEKTNNSLCMDNDARMFVTTFLVFYNIKTGEFVYANGGHHTASILSLDGEYECFGALRNMALGFLPDINRVGKKTLKKGDTIILYTDGVIEAISPEGEEFGEEKLENILLTNRELGLGQLCDTVVDAVAHFEVGSRFDDITLLMLKKL